MGLSGFACKSREPAKAALIPEVGHIQVLNASGIAGAAQTVAASLRARGFDVVEVGNYDEWYFPHTVVASRTSEMTIARQVAAALYTQRVFLLRQEGVLLDATVYVGKDFMERKKKS